MQDEILNHLETDKNGSFNIKMNQNDELVPRDCRSG